MDGEAGDSPPPPQPKLQNQTPQLLSTGVGLVVSTIESYGWLLLIGFLLLVFLYQKFRPSYEKWKQEQDERRDEELRKKDPDRSYAIQISMEQARMKMQERVKADAEAKRIRDAELAEKKRLEKIEEWENHKQGKGYHSKSSKKSSQDENSSPTNNQLKSKRSDTFRPAYNPLTGGGGGSSGYRPSRNTGRSGGVTEKTDTINEFGCKSDLCGYQENISCTELREQAFRCAGTCDKTLANEIVTNDNFAS